MMKRTIYSIFTTAIFCVIALGVQAQSADERPERIVFDGPEAKVVKVKTQNENSNRIKFSGPEPVTKRLESSSSNQPVRIVFDGPKAQVIRTKPEKSSK